MDFTRQPIVESIITPREGFRLVVRSSKSMGQEEHFVDALEVVTFGGGLFFRSSERPKPFLIPASDYEVVEVREQRLVLKTPANEGAQAKSQAPQRREPRSYTPPPAPSPSFQEKEEMSEEGSAFQTSESGEGARPEASGRQEGRSEGRGESGRGEPGRGEPRSDRRRDRHRRRRERGPREERREGDTTAQSGQPGEGFAEGALPASSETAISYATGEAGQEQATGQIPPPALFRTILPPPTTLIRDNIQQLRENELYRGAFYIREKEGAEGAVAEGKDDDDATLASIDADMEFHTAHAKEAPPREETFLSVQTSGQEVHENPQGPL